MIAFILAISTASGEFGAAETIYVPANRASVRMRPATGENPRSGTDRGPAAGDLLALQPMPEARLRGQVIGRLLARMPDRYSTALTRRALRSRRRAVFAAGGDSFSGRARNGAVSRARRPAQGYFLGRDSGGT